MNKKRNLNADRDPPVWLVNLVIRLRVARWRLAERLNRWAAGKKPWQLRLYFMLFLVIGFLTFYLILIGVLRPRHEAKMRQLEAYNYDLKREIDWARKSDDPRLQNNEQFYWRLLDSLMADSSLRHSVDSLLKARPGMADTLHQVEQMHPRIIKLSLDK